MGSEKIPHLVTGQDIENGRFSLYTGGKCQTLSKSTVIVNQSKKCDKFS